MRIAPTESLILNVLTHDWITCRTIYSELVKSGRELTYYDVRVSIDGLHLRGAVEVKRSGLPWPDIIEVRRV